MSETAIPPVGFSPEAFAEELKEKAEREKYSSVGQQLVAGVEGVAKGLTLGVSTVLEAEIAKKLGAAGAAEVGLSTEDIAGRSETDAATAGEIASFLMPMAAGTKLGQKALGKLGTEALELSAPSLINKASAATGRAIQGALPEAQTLLGKALNKAIVEGAKGTAEGAIYGLGQAISENALDPEYTAEAALANVGWGAALGGGFGGALGLAEVGIPAAVGKAKDAIKKAFTKGESALGSLYKAGEQLTGTAGDVAELMVNKRSEIEALVATMPTFADDMAKARTPEMAEWMLRNGERLSQMSAMDPGIAKALAGADVKTADYLLNNWDKIVRDPMKRIEMGKNMAEDLEAVLSAVDDAHSKINKHLAPDEAEHLIAQRFRGKLDDSKITKDAFVEMLGGLDDGLSQMRNEPELYAQNFAKKLEKIRDGFVVDMEKARNPVEYFKRLRRLRQDIDDAIPYGKDAMKMSVAEQDSVKVLSKLRARAKEALTDKAIFGEAAARRAALDEMSSKYLARRDNFRSTFGKKLKRPGGVEYVIDPAKVNSWLTAMKDQRGDFKSAIWGEMMESAQQAAKELEGYAGRVSAVKPDASGIKGLLERVSQRTTSIQEDAAVTQVRKMLDGPEILSSGPFISKDQGREMAESVGMAILPSVAKGALRSVSSVLKTAKSVPTGLTALSLLERAGRTAEKAIDAGVSGVLRAAPAAKRIGAGYAGFSQPGREETKKRMERVRELSSNIEAAQGALETQGAGLDEAPRTAQAAQMASARGIAFLASKLPDLQPPGMLAKPLEPNGEQAFAFNRYYDAVDKPLSVLERARQGTLTPLDVEAVSSVYPQLMAKVRETLLSQLMEREGMLPYRQRLMAGMLLGQDVDGSMSQQSIQSAQATYQAQTPQAPQSPPGSAVRPSQAGLSKLSLGSRLRTGPQASAERLAE